MALEHWVTEARVAKALKRLDELVEHGVGKTGSVTTQGKALERALGCLVSISQVICVGRTWTAELRYHLRLANREHRAVRLSVAALLEVAWWRGVLTRSSGSRVFVRSFKDRGPAKPAFLVDASGWGFGGWWPHYHPGGSKEGKSLYMCHQWNGAELGALGDLLRKSGDGERFRVSMATCEAFVMLAMVEACCEQLRGGLWIVWTDNDPTLHAMKSGAAKKADWSGLILRRLWELREIYDFDLSVRRVSTRDNVEADAFSRKDGKSVVLRWLAKHGITRVHQVHASQELRGFFVKAALSRHE